MAGVIGQVLLRGDNGVYYSPWFPRGGDAAVMTVEVIEQISGGTILVTVETKNSENDDTAISANAWPDVARGVGVWSWQAGRVAGIAAGAGFDELVRFKDEIASQDGDGVHFRMLNPSWITN